MMLLCRWMSYSSSISLPSKKLRARRWVNVASATNGTYLPVRFHRRGQTVWVFTLLDEVFHAFNFFFFWCSVCVHHCRLKLINMKPTRLYCKTCDETYALPQNGTIKLFMERSCPLDGMWEQQQPPPPPPHQQQQEMQLLLFLSSHWIFLICTIWSVASRAALWKPGFELVLFSTGGANGIAYPLCPYCYNSPPFKVLLTTDREEKISLDSDSLHPLFFVLRVGCVQ